MDLIETDIYLTNILKGKVDQDKIEKSGTLVFELMSRLSFDFSDVCYLLYTYPEVIERNPFSVVNNLIVLNNTLNLKDIEIKYLILKLPVILSIDSEVLLYKLKLISATYGCSIKDSIKLLYSVPDLLFITKSFVIKQNQMLSKELNEYGLKFRTIFRSEPKLLFVNEEIIKTCKKVLMRDFTLSEDESQKVIISSPNIVEDEKMLTNVFNLLYPTYFIKRDLKEILVSCPEILNINVEKIIETIDELKTEFSMKHKDACDFIRLEPRVLFFNNLISRIKGFRKYNINFKYILSSPKMCLSTDISVALKFLITRILYLDDHFNEICMFDSNLFICRFLFMQAYGFYNHLDLILNEEEFFAKYNISSRVLMLNYNLDYDNLKNICECYVNNKDKIKCWSDIMFPDIHEIIKYFNNDFDFDSLQTKSYINFKENSKFTKLQYDLYRVFKSMGLSIDEIQFVFNKNKAINKFKGVDCLKVVKELRKYGYTKEKIIKLIMSKQYLFNYNINDFVLLIEEISANKNCSTFEAVENYL